MRRRDYTDYSTHAGVSFYAESYLLVEEPSSPQF